MHHISCHCLGYRIEGILVARPAPKTFPYNWDQGFSRTVKLEVRPSDSVVWLFGTSMMGGTPATSASSLGFSHSSSVLVEIPSCLVYQRPRSWQDAYRWRVEWGAKDGMEMCCFKAWAEWSSDPPRIGWARGMSTLLYLLSRDSGFNCAGWSSLIQGLSFE